MSLAKEVTEFLIGERRPFCFSADSLARMILTEAVHNPSWSKATFQEWEKAIKEAISRGLIVEKDKKLGLPVIVEESKPQQMGLFE